MNIGLERAPECICSTLVQYTQSVSSDSRVFQPRAIQLLDVFGILAPYKSTVLKALVYNIFPRRRWFSTTLWHNPISSTFGISFWWRSPNHKAVSVTHRPIPGLSSTLTFRICASTYPSQLSRCGETIVQFLDCYRSSLIQKRITKLFHEAVHHSINNKWDTTVDLHNLNSDRSSWCFAFSEKRYRLGYFIKQSFLQIVTVLSMSLCFIAKYILCTVLQTVLELVGEIWET